MPGQVLLASIRADRYASAVALVLGVVLVAGIFISARRTQKKPPEERFHPTKLWKTPYETTRTGLLLRTAFASVAGFVGFNVVSFVVWLIDGGDSSYFSANSVQFLAFVPFLYWNTRSAVFSGFPGESAGWRESSAPALRPTERGLSA